ncbi:phosphoribosyltransferase [Agromyces badenianii]|uniref:Phosphoribosyltransferase n=1 Tax=Agromyces badenianii TaxID=2080742 RepID=A0A2S0WZK0_9MICO|nr:phosphoribosyltransferase [Agromyces badenianii]AWB96797.1 phosphoribosyltransferase [Agromyces badenianii]PWC03348.1 phosphoribosyltransferase [Agromyces badenianii]
MTFDANDAGLGSGAVRREILTWDEFGDAARSLAEDVLRSGFRPDVVIAIARGGLLLAGAISYALGTKACGSINVEFYSGIDERLPEPVLHPPMLDAPALGGKRVLLVDDVSDSGRTLAKVLGLLTDEGADVRTATLYTKSHTVLAPDFDYRRTDDWIVFPWSALPPVAATAADASTGAA